MEGAFCEREAQFVKGKGGLKKGMYAGSHNNRTPPHFQKWPASIALSAILAPEMGSLARKTYKMMPGFILH